MQPVESPPPQDPSPEQPGAQTGAKLGKWIVIIVTAAVLLAVLVPRSSHPRANVRPISARQAMPDFTLKDLSGSEWQLSAHKGSVVLVNFWASWCGPCRAETPGLVRVAHSYAPKGLVVAGIAMDEGGIDPVRRFIREYDVDYPILLRQAGFLLGDEVENLPTTLLIDRKGRLARTYVGQVHEDVFRADVESLLGESGS